MRAFCVLLGGSALAVWAAGPARAQHGAAAPADQLPVLLAPGPDVYSPAAFAQYAPRTALDMLRNVPGFTI